jgi:hypothetical protein
VLDLIPCVPAVPLTVAGWSCWRRVRDLETKRTVAVRCEGLLAVRGLRAASKSCSPTRPCGGSPGTSLGFVRIRMNRRGRRWIVRSVWRLTGLDCQECLASGSLAGLWILDFAVRRNRRLTVW